MSLVDAFCYEGRIGGFDLFAVFAATYLDESGNVPGHRRVGYAATLGSSAQWLRFSNAWDDLLRDEAVVGKLSDGKRYDFHAKSNGKVQRHLNRTLPSLMREHRIYSVCVTVDEDEYRSIATADDLSQMGNAYGFSGYAAASFMAQVLRNLDKGDAGYYVDQGGKGSAKVMQLLGDMYRDDESRMQFRMARFGSADRRFDLPVHTADLVAHEAVSSGERSSILQALEDDVYMVEVTPIDIAEVLTSYRELFRHYTREHRRRRNAEKRAKKQRERE